MASLLTGSQAGWGALEAVIFLGIGLFIFFRGFFAYRRYRLLADLPIMPIRSVAMGLVEIQGRAVPDRIIMSPITHTSCLYFKVEIQAVEKEKGGHTNLARVGTDTGWAKFYLQDDTGKILVDPEGADLRLESTTHRETSPSPEQSPAFPTDSPSLGTPSDQELNRYGAAFQARRRRWPLLHVLQKLWIAAFYNRGGVYRPTGAYRFTESCLLPYKTYVIAGNCTTNPQPRDEHDRNLIERDRQRSPLLLIREGTEKQVESTLRYMSGCAIYGGAILAIFSMAGLLYLLGLLRLPWK